jgi:hypothetical protein
MTMETGVNFIWFFGAFALVVSALIARRLPLTDWIKMSLAWVAIFGLLFLVIRMFQAVT